jgi:cell division transport system permease protein
MRLSTIGFLLRESLSGLVRHRLMTLAAVSTSAICFTVMGFFLAALFLLHSLAASFTSELGVMVFMKTNAARAESQRAQMTIAGLPGVAGVRLVTREQAWSRMKKDYGQLPLEGVIGNPLGDELHVTLADVDHIAPVARAAGKVGGVAEVEVLRDMVKKVQATERVVKRLGAGAAGLLLLATLLVIANVIRLTVFARRREIHIMQLVGATNGFIRTPFLLEGFLHGAVGGGIAAALVLYAGGSVLNATRQTLPFMPLNAADVPAQTLALALIGAGAAVGVLGSAASVRKFLVA